jgi:hypothetical protein
MKAEIGRIWKEAAVAIFNIEFQHLPIWAGEDHDIPQSR